MDFKRMPIEIESPEQLGYDRVRFNLTESSVSDVLFSDLNFSFGELKLGYTDHRGDRELRNLLVSGFPSLNAENTIITAGAASALFIAATSLLDKKDHLVVVRPNYASNIETPRAIGCSISYCDLRFEKQFRIDIQKITKLIRPETTLISITSPHNPTGSIITQEELEELALIAEKHDLFILVDETYRELAGSNIVAPAASLHPRMISVSSVSKAYGLPGIRIGWMMTQNGRLAEKFLAAKEQIFLCNSVIDEKIALEFLRSKNQRFAEILAHIEKNRKILDDWFQTESRLEVIKPGGGVVCFPRIREPELFDIPKFYEVLNKRYETFVGNGHWFEMPDHYFRIGFGWPTAGELEQGLKNISSALIEAIKKKG